MSRKSNRVVIGLKFNKQNVEEEWIFKNNYSNAGTITLRKDGRIMLFINQVLNQKDTPSFIGVSF